MLLSSAPRRRAADLLRIRIYSFPVKSSLPAAALLPCCPRETPRHSLHFTETIGDRFGGLETIMETWFLNHVLGLCLLVLHLGLPRPLGAGTPGNNSTDPGTAGLRYSAAADELRTAGNDATSTSYSSETLSPSQRSLLLRRAAAGSSGK